MMMYGGRDAATGAAVRPPDLAVVRQADVDHGLPSVIVLRVTLMSPSSPVCGRAGLPQPLSSKAWAADTRAVSDVLFLAMPASVWMPNSVWARAKERKSAGALAI